MTHCDVIDKDFAKSSFAINFWPDLERISSIYISARKWNTQVNEGSKNSNNSVCQPGSSAVENSVSSKDIQNM